MNTKDVDALNRVKGLGLKAIKYINPAFYWSWFVFFGCTVGTFLWLLIGGS